MDAGVPSEPLLEPVTFRPASEASVRPASVAVRTGAFLIDMVVLAILLSFAGVIGYLLTPIGSTTSSAVVVIEVLAMLGLSAVLAVFAWSRLGTTPGMALGGVRVEAADGGRLPPTRGLIRWALLIAPSIVATATDGALGPTLAAAWLVVLLLSAVVDRGGRGLHDRISGSRVIAVGRHGRRLALVLLAVLVFSIPGLLIALTDALCCSH